MTPNTAQQYKSRRWEVWAARFSIGIIVGFIALLLVLNGSYWAAGAILAVGGGIFVEASR